MALTPTNIAGSMECIGTPHDGTPIPITLHTFGGSNGSNMGMGVAKGAL
jgi:hypothetical protein